MKYQKQSGRSKAPAAQSGRWVLPEPTDRYRYANTVRYTPARIGEIMAAANSGETEQLCICAREILERNWDVITALDQRAEALLGVKWEILPGGNGPNDKAAAEAFRTELEGCGALNNLDTFYDLVRNMEDAVICPFSASEIVWEPGGAIAGFQSVDPWHFTLRESYEPLLISDEFPNGMPLPANKFIIHRTRKTADPVRSGRIRTLAWLHLFQNWPIKDLFSFVERFGMPFVMAKVDKQTWDEERGAVQSMIKSFGPSGGGVFTQSTEVELLQAANTGGDNIYLKILEYTHDAIFRLLVGQTASSSEGGGLSGDTAQSKVRQDILESDARAVEATIISQIAAPWTEFNYGPAAAVPRIHFQVEPPEDLAAFATMVQTLYNSGLQANPAEIGKKVGLTLTLKPEPSQMPGNGLNNLGLAADDPKKKSGSPDALADEAAAEVINSGVLESWLGPLAEAVTELSGETDDETFKKRLAKLADKPPFGDSAGFEKTIFREAVTGIKG